MLLSISFAVKTAMLDWEWLGIDEKEWPPQRLDWEAYHIEHLAFASNMEAAFDGWLQQPWHILYSALRCMACQEWQQQHVCPICRKSDRNIGGKHSAWAYFDGCITHLGTAPLKVYWQSPQQRSIDWTGNVVDSLCCNVMPAGASQCPVVFPALR